MKSNIKYFILHPFKYMVIDALAIVLSYIITIWMYNVLNVPGLHPEIYENIYVAIPVIILFKWVVQYIIGVYRIVTKHAGFEDALRIFFVVIATNIIVVLYIYLTDAKFMFKSAYIFITLFETTLMVMPRLVRRIYNHILSNFKWLKAIGVKTLIVGAGSAGEMVVKEIYKNKSLNNLPVAMVDDDKHKIGHRLMGIQILGPIKNIGSIIEKYHIEEVIIAISDYPNHKFKELMECLLKHQVKVRRLVTFMNVDDKSASKIVDIKIEDLLERDVIKLDNDGLSEFITGQTVLVTGGGGSIGSELCRQIFDLHPKKLVIFDIYENSTYDIQMELLRKQSKHHEYKDIQLVVRIGSVYNKNRLEDIFKTYQPNVVFHAAAYKHVPLMEDSAVEAIRTNVIGTYNCSSLSNQYGVKKFVLVSSDKAVRSTNVMGATKRFAELIIQDQNNQGKTSFSSVRFGNVLGSNGSVIPLFKKQIEDGGPVTLTHKEITRYFMTIPEAVGLILQCGVYAKGGEVFVLDMGEPVKIYDLAKKMIRLAGYKPEVDIDIEIVGLRPGEKLYEELLVNVNDQNHDKTDNQKIFVEKQKDVSHQELTLESIIETIETLGNDEAKDLVASVVTTYQIKR